jgi:hypothetical protein
MANESKDKQEAAVSAPQPIPYYGILPERPVYEGMGCYRAPLNFELAGREFKLVFDDNTGATLRGNSGDSLTWHEKGGEPRTEYYECAKIDELTYFVNFEFDGLKPRTNITLVLDLEQNLVSKITTRTQFDPQFPILCDNNVVFGAIATPGLPLPAIRHSFTRDLIGKRIYWHYSPELEIIHVYYNEHRQCVTFPEGKGWGNVPVDEWNALLEAYPYDEPAWYVKIKERIYLVSVIEQNMVRRGWGGEQPALPHRCRTGP